MMTSEHYIISIENPQIGFSHRDTLMEFQHKIFKTNFNGTTWFAQGSFGCVFCVYNNLEPQYAVKCFYSDFNLWGNRYSAIRKHFLDKTLELTKKVDSIPTWILDFRIFPKGIYVNCPGANGNYPLVIMSWAKNCIDLGEYISQNYKDKNKIRALARAIYQLSQECERYNISHCDIHHGNIMVDTSKDINNGIDCLKLIDYDGMFVPSMAGQTTVVSGYDGYQHNKFKNLYSTHLKFRI